MNKHESKMEDLQKRLDRIKGKKPDFEEAITPIRKLLPEPRLLSSDVEVACLYFLAEIQENHSNWSFDENNFEPLI